MSGTQEDSSRSLAILRDDASSRTNATRPPVLGGISEAELDAIVSQLRTDKNLVIAPVPAASERWGALTEQRLLSTTGLLGPLESEAAREEAARNAWHIALGDRVTGPLDIAALRTHWERGELGPDSLCWRKGFDDWRRVCRVPGLAELLAPRQAAEPSRPEDLVPSAHAGAPDFPLKGAEAVRILAEDVPPPLPKAPAPLPPFLEPEPATAPALEPEPATLPEAPQAQDAAGAHPVLSARLPTQVEVRVRGGAWLALGGGLVGGMLVVFVMWLLGLSPMLGVHSRGAPREPATSTGTAGAVASAPSPAPPHAATLPVPMVSKPEGTAVAAANPGTLPAPVASKPDVTALVPAISAGSALGGAASAVTSPPAPTPLAKPTPVGGETVEAPRPVVAPVRPVPPDPPMQKLAKAEVSTQPESSDEEHEARADDVEEEVEDDLGLDEEFARELDKPAKRAAPEKPTVWIPPSPPASEPPALLSQSDIFSVVVANKGDITACVSEQKLQSEEGNRRVVVRWTVLPSGKVTEVATETDGFQGTPLALCLEGKIRSWTFPKHREQGGPIRFPFVF